MSKNYVIFDCDGGSDDAWALLFLLKAHDEKRIVLLGITICGCGNANLENAARNMLRILKVTEHLEIPLYLGAAAALMPSRKIQNVDIFHGNDGFGDVLPIESETELNVTAHIKAAHAVNFIYETCKNHHKEVDIIAVGPLTNIALCLSMYGDNLAKSIREIYIMGGNYQGIGNCTPHAEFNFYCDAEAAYIVFDKATCPIVVLPWEPCMEDRFFISLKWRLEEFGMVLAANHPAVMILNKVETAQYIPNGFSNWNPCDAFIVAVYLFNLQFVREQRMRTVTVDVTTNVTRSKMLIDAEAEEYMNLQNATNVKRKPNVRVIEKVDDEFFKRALHWCVGLTQLKDQNQNRT